MFHAGCANLRGVKKLGEILRQAKIDSIPAFLFKLIKGVFDSLTSHFIKKYPITPAPTIITA